MTPPEEAPTSLSAEGALLPDGRISSGGVDISLQDGVIADIGPGDGAGRWAGCLAVPGLIQSHLHLCQTLFRGTAENRPLLAWLEERIWPLEAASGPDDVAASVILALRELLSTGCTGIADMGSVEHSRTTIDILRRAGIRAATSIALMDLGPQYIARPPSWLKERAALSRRACGGLVEWAWAPRFALSCSDRIWDWVAEEALPDEVRMTHACESTEEALEPRIAETGGGIRFLHQRRFLGPRTILAHCVHPTDGELPMLAESKTSVCHCPWPNLRLGSGIADVPALAGAGIPILVGSDGAACNNRLTLAEDVRLAMSLASATGLPGGLDGSYWLSAVTERAAQSLGWERVGRLSRGWQADLALVHLDELQWAELDDSEDPTRYLLEIPWESSVRLTMVAGRTLYRDGEFPTLPPLPADPAALREGLLARAGKLPGWNPGAGDG